MSMEQFIWWIVMMCREGGLNTAMRAAGILCVTVAGVKKMQEWSVKLLAMIHLFLVMSATLHK